MRAASPWERVADPSKEISPFATKRWTNGAVAARTVSAGRRRLMWSAACFCRPPLALYCAYASATLAVSSYRYSLVILPSATWKCMAMGIR